MTKFERHMLKARIKQKIATAFAYAIAIPVGIVGGSIALLFGALVLAAALWPLWLSAAAIALTGHYIGWW